MFRQSHRADAGSYRIIANLLFDHEITTTHIHEMLLGIVLPLIMLNEEDYFWGQASGDAGVHLVAGSHEVLCYLQIIRFILCACVDAVKVS